MTGTAHHVVRTREFIKERLPRVKDERRALQRAGERLDRADNGAWVREGLVRAIEAAQAGTTPTGMFVVILFVFPVRSRQSGRRMARRSTTSTFMRKMTNYGSDTLKKVSGLGSCLNTGKCRGTRPRGESSSWRTWRTSWSLRIGVRRKRYWSVQRLCWGCIRVTGRHLWMSGRGPIRERGKRQHRWLHRPRVRFLCGVGGPNAGHQVYREPSPEVYHHLPSGTGRAPKAKLLSGQEQYCIQKGCWPKSPSTTYPPTSLDSPARDDYRGCRSRFRGADAREDRLDRTRRGRGERA